MDKECNMWSANNIKYNFVEEPEVVFEEIKNDDRVIKAYLGE